MTERVRVIPPLRIPGQGAEKTLRQLIEATASVANRLGIDGTEVTNTSVSFLGQDIDIILTVNTEKP